jgi:hypothetical protein
VRELLLLDADEQLKVTAIGLKMFERQDSKVSVVVQTPAQPLHAERGERTLQGYGA